MLIGDEHGIVHSGLVAPLCMAACKEEYESGADTDRRRDGDRPAQGRGSGEELPEYSPATGAIMPPE